jgi:hypothetical protein
MAVTNSSSFYSFGTSLNERDLFDALDAFLMKRFAKFFFSTGLEGSEEVDKGSVELGDKYCLV